MLKLLFPRRAAKHALAQRVHQRKIERATTAYWSKRNPDNWGLVRQRGTL